jgi:hypothetical protein
MRQMPHRNVQKRNQEQEHDTWIPVGSSDAKISPNTVLIQSPGAKTLY